MSEVLGQRAHGGPFDGADLRPSLSVEFVWVDGKRCYAKPGVGRSLYRRMRNRAGDLVLIFVGYTFVLCSCGAYHRRGPRIVHCTLCGARLGSV